MRLIRPWRWEWGEFNHGSSGGMAAESVDDVSVMMKRALCDVAVQEVIGLRGGNRAREARREFSKR